MVLIFFNQNLPNIIYRHRAQREPGNRLERGLHQPGQRVLRGGAGHRREELLQLRGLQAEAHPRVQHGLLRGGGRPLPLGPSQQ